jgi:hypothetical protein
MTCLRNLVIGVLCQAGPVNLAPALRRQARDPHRPWATSESDSDETDITTERGALGRAPDLESGALDSAWPGKRAVARRPVWRRWPETATRLRPCHACRVGTDARLGAATWPLTRANGTRREQEKWRGWVVADYGSGGCGFGSWRQTALGWAWWACCGGVGRSVGLGKPQGARRGGAAVQIVLLGDVLNAGTVLGEELLVGPG